MSSVYGTNIPTAKPTKKVIDDRSLSHALSGPESPYPVYQFSFGRWKIERRGHNPFSVTNILLNENGQVMLGEDGEWLSTT